jgi:hypothetical protein
VIGDQEAYGIGFNRCEYVLSDLVADTYPLDLARPVPELEADGIPGSRGLGSCPLCEVFVDLFDCRHKRQSNPR